MHQAVDGASEHAHCYRSKAAATSAVSCGDELYEICGQDQASWNEQVEERGRAVQYMALETDATSTCMTNRKKKQPSRDDEELGYIGSRDSRSNPVATRTDTMEREMNITIRGIKLYIATFAITTEYQIS